MEAISRDDNILRRLTLSLSRLSELFAALTSGILSLSIFYFRSEWSHVKPSLPLSYFADPLYYANLVHNAQLGNPLLGKNLGGPLGQQFSMTAYGFEWIQSWFVSIFAPASGGPWLAMNRFVLFTFFITGFCAYVAFRWLAVNRPIAILCSLSFTLIPDHQPYDVGLANMAALALIMALVWKIATGTPITELFRFRFTEKWSEFQRVTWNVLIFIALGLFQLTAATYYLLLPTLLALSILIYLFITPGNIQRIKGLSIFIFSQMCITMICLGPIIISRTSVHLPFSEPSTGDRRPFAAYANGGDLFALFSPFSSNSIYAQTISHLPRVSSFYQEYLNSPITLGSEYIIHRGGMIFAFMLLTFLIYFVARARTTQRENFIKDYNKLNLHMLLVIFLLTFGWYFRGGFGTFEAFVFPYVRGYARYSVLLTFYGLAIFGVLATKLPRKPLKIYVAAMLIAVLIDTASAIPAINQINTTALVRVIGDGELAGASTLAHGITLRSLGYFGTRKLDSAASKYLRSGCTVLELPLVTYPVDFSIGITSYYTYELIKPGLEDSDIKWSAGGVPNSPNNRFSDLWLGNYQEGDYSGFFSAVANGQYCGILFFRGIQNAFYKAGGKNGSYYGSSDELTKQIVANFGLPCYSDIASAVDLYCVKIKRKLQN